MKRKESPLPLREGFRGRGISRALASGAGIGFVPIAPGTAASALAAVTGGLLLREGRPWLGAAAAAASLLGLGAAAMTPTIADDPGWVVIDEIAGQWITLLGLSAPTPRGVLAAFLLFRLLDVAKPGPVGWADRKKGALGVMLDDVIAGGIAAGVLTLARLIS